MFEHCVYIGNFRNRNTAEKIGPLIISSWEMLTLSFSIVVNFTRNFMFTYLIEFMGNNKSLLHFTLFSLFHSVIKIKWCHSVAFAHFFFHEQIFILFIRIEAIQHHWMEYIILDAHSKVFSMLFFFARSNINIKSRSLFAFHKANDVKKYVIIDTKYWNLFLKLVFSNRSFSCIFFISFK